jgi:hypothetical protein
MEDVLLLLDNGRPHVSLGTTKAVTKFRLTVLPHPSYNADLTSPHCRLFGKFKDSIRGGGGGDFEYDGSFVASVKEWLRSADFTVRAYMSFRGSVKQLRKIGTTLKNIS